MGRQPLRAEFVIVVVVVDAALVRYLQSDRPERDCALYLELCLCGWADRGRLYAAVGLSQTGLADVRRALCAGHCCALTDLAVHRHGAHLAIARRAGLRQPFGPPAMRLHCASHTAFDVSLVRSGALD